MNIVNCRHLLVVAIIGVLPSTAMAGAAYIYEMSSVSEPGYGGAGMVARANDAGSAAYIQPMSERLKLGISMQNYFGLALNWNDQWAGRYSSVSVALVAPQLQPTVAYKVNDWLSVGAGAALTLGYLSDKMRVDPVDPRRPDGKLTLSDTDFAVQGNFGVMIQASPDTRIGIRYLTETDLDFKDAPDVSRLALNLNTQNLDPGLKMLPHYSVASAATHHPK